MSTTEHSTIAPTPEELQALSEEANAWMQATGRKRFPREKQDELAALGAKRCGTCRTVKAVTEYNKDASRTDGLRPKCQPCHRGAAAEYHAANYYEGSELRERQIEYQRNRRTDPEVRQREREYREANYLTHPTMRLNHQLRDGKYRTLKAGGVVEDFGAAELLEFWEQQGIPADRDYFTNEVLDPATRSVDHLWPISEGGPHIRAALVPVTIGTNLAKRAMSPSEFRAWLRSEGIEPAERPDPTPFLIEALADRAAAQDPEDLPPLVQRALSTSAPVRKKRTVVVSLEEQEGDDNA